MTTARTLGHLALYYRPGDMEASRRLLQDLGCTLVENGPRPGEDGFCTVLVDDATAKHADNILFLAPSARSRKSSSARSASSSVSTRRPADRRRRSPT